MLNWCVSRNRYFYAQTVLVQNMKSTKNVVVVHVLQHFSTEYVVTKLVLQYEKKRYDWLKIILPVIYLDVIFMYF